MSSSVNVESALLLAVLAATPGKTRGLSDSPRIKRGGGGSIAPYPALSLRGDSRGDCDRSAEGPDGSGAAKLLSSAACGDVRGSVFGRELRLIGGQPLPTGPRHAGEERGSVLGRCSSLCERSVHAPSPPPASAPSSAELADSERCGGRGGGIRIVSRCALSAAASVTCNTCNGGITDTVPPSVVLGDCCGNDQDVVLGAVPITE